MVLNAVFNKIYNNSVTMESTKCIEWDINDSNIPVINDYDEFSEWVNGHCRLVYSATSDDARKHTSGWAMRNTNNHNVNILKKSCLGVLLCSANCVLPNGEKVHLRPAICDKARKKQQTKACPNRNCSGRLKIQPCKGHCGYPVTHFWRQIGNSIFFQSKGVHDHPRPEAKGSNDIKKLLSSDRKNTRNISVLLARDAAVKTKLSSLKSQKSTFQPTNPQMTDQYCSQAINQIDQFDNIKFYERDQHLPLYSDDGQSDVSIISQNQLRFRSFDDNSSLTSSSSNSVTDDVYTFLPNETYPSDQCQYLMDCQYNNPNESNNFMLDPSSITSSFQTLYYADNSLPTYNFNNQHCDLKNNNFDYYESQEKNEFWCPDVNVENYNSNFLSLY
ncbi:gcm family protein [Megaselia abdita]